jgi:hypothetical protein
MNYEQSLQVQRQLEGVPGAIENLVLGRTKIAQDLEQKQMMVEQQLTQQNELKQAQVAQTVMALGTQEVQHRQQKEIQKNQLDQQTEMKIYESRVQAMRDITSIYAASMRGKHPRDPDPQVLAPLWAIARGTTGLDSLGAPPEATGAAMPGAPGEPRTWLGDHRARRGGARAAAPGGATGSETGGDYPPEKLQATDWIDPSLLAGIKTKYPSEDPQDATQRHDNAVIEEYNAVMSNKKMRGKVSAEWLEQAQEVKDRQNLKKAKIEELNRRNQAGQQRTKQIIQKMQQLQQLQPPPAKPVPARPGAASSAQPSIYSPPAGANPPSIYNQPTKTNPPSIYNQGASRLWDAPAGSNPGETFS